MFVLITLLLLTITMKSYSEDKFSIIENNYFGAEPLGLMPKIFAPDIISPEGLFEGRRFSPDTTKFYFMRKNVQYQQRTFFVIQYENNGLGIANVPRAVGWSQKLKENF